MLKGMSNSGTEEVKSETKKIVDTFSKLLPLLRRGLG